MSPTAADLLPEVRSYLASIAEAHGEEPPDFDDAAMTAVLEQLLEPEKPERNGRDGEPLRHGFDADQPRDEKGRWTDAAAALSDAHPEPPPLPHEIMMMAGLSSKKMTDADPALKAAAKKRDEHSGAGNRANVVWALKAALGIGKQPELPTMPSASMDAKRLNRNGQKAQNLADDAERILQILSPKSGEHMGAVAESHPLAPEMILAAREAAKEQLAGAVEVENAYRAALGKKPRVIKEPQQHSRNGKPRRYAFDPNEPRDASGEWTAGGASGKAGKPKSQARQEWESRKAAAEAAHGQALAAHAEASQKQADDYAAAMAAYDARVEDRQGRDDAAYSAGDDLINLDKPEPAEEPNAAYGDEMLGEWKKAFGEGGALSQELAAAGANEKELKKLAITGERGADALQKFRERAEKAQYKFEALKGDVQEHEESASEQPEEPTDRPEDPETPWTEGNHESDKEWDAAIAAQEKWDEGWEKWNEKQEKWANKSDDLGEKLEAAQEKAAEAWAAMDDGWDAWRDKLSGELQSVQLAIRERIEKEADADEEPEEPEEIEEPEPPEEEDEPEEDEEETDEEEEREPKQGELFGKPGAPHV